MSAERCPLCNGAMTYPVMFERLQVCVDCHDHLSGKSRGHTRERWRREDQVMLNRLRGRRGARAVRW